MSLPDMRGKRRKGFVALGRSSEHGGPLAVFYPDWVEPEDLTPELDEWFFRPLVAPTRADLERQAPGHHAPEQLAARIDFYGGVCWICRSAPGTTVDHVKPLARGGSNWPSNLRPACRSCNARKGAIWPFRPSLVSVIRRDPSWPPMEEPSACPANDDTAAIAAA